MTREYPLPIILSMIISQEIQPSDWRKGDPPCGLFVCDFDGTLLRSDRSFSNADLEALRQLDEFGIVRVIATGRSIYSLNTVSISELPMDFIIFSSGAGVTQHPGGHIIRNVSLEADEVSRAIAILQAGDLDFMVHRPIPDNHVFGYFESSFANADFKRRVDLYSQFAFPLDDVSDGFGTATQLLAILPPAGSLQVLETLRKQLPGFNIIQTTSPLDGQSIWIEIFPATVSKGLTVAWLTSEFDIDPGRTLSIGNDYNDLDLLEWTASSFVVENAPDDLKERFPVVASNNESGVAEAIQRWLASSQF
ncbi:MAG: HAD family hydrolase [Desulfobacterales bacterium]|nr:HAD family hydrolase [Desulfobacterales bacterium]